MVFSEAPGGTEMTTVRTRFAPSPTGFIHLGNIRSALFPWAFAKANGGVFVLRIEDTDVERSSQQAVDVILQSMAWLGLTPDEGPYYQMQRMARYKDVLGQMLEAGQAYRCYTTPTELDALREQQMADKLKPRYDGRWRPEPGKILPPIPAGVEPVIRFRNPVGGSVAWDDKVKGPIEIANDELDDLVIARPADAGSGIGTPTYNFCVVIDDIDMAITHVIRGDDHVNNTPRQINILRALGAEPPVYAHLPTVLNEQGEKMSKRHGAKPVTQYRDEGYLADAVINYLARLGWSHGDDEIFSREQLLQWFNLDHLGKSAGQFDEGKLRWVNQQHLKAAPAATLLPLLIEQFERRGTQIDPQASWLEPAIALFKDRCTTTVELADWLQMMIAPVEPSADDVAAHLDQPIAAAVKSLADRLLEAPWDKNGIAAAIKQTLGEHGMKMPQLATAVRVLVCGRSQTPSVDAVLALFERDTVVARLRKFEK